MAAPSFIVGLLGNVISILVFASPITTFSRIVEKKSTQNYEGLPYVTTLLCTSLWTCYGLLKPGGLLVVTVNGLGSVIQAFYVILFLIYAPTNTRIKIAKLVAILNIGFLGVVILVVLLACYGNLRLLIIGCMCATFTVGMYAAPMTVMRLVVQTKNVEFMPFSLSFFLFLNAGVWSAYATLKRDFFLGIPNAIGFILGTAQLILYEIYRGKTPLVSKEAEDLESIKVANLDQVIVGQLEMGTINKPRISLHKGASLPLKRTVSRQQSLTKIVKSLSLPPYENSNWSLDDHLENGAV